MTSSPRHFITLTKQQPGFSDARSGLAGGDRLREWFVFTGNFFGRYRYLIICYFRNNSNIGGNFGSGQLVNHISYADDMCLLSFSSAGMQKLLNIPHVYLCVFRRRH